MFKRFLFLGFLSLFFVVGVTNAALVNCYIFDNDATDSCASNDGAVTGATTAPGYFSLSSGKSAYTFDGVDDYIVLTRASFEYSAGNDFSLEAWINSTKSDALIHSIFTNGDNDASKYFRLTLYSTEAGDFQINTGGGNFLGARASNDICDGKWHHLVAVYDGTHALLYEDGVLVATDSNSGGALAGDFFDATAKAVIGAKWDNNLTIYVRDLDGTVGGFRNYDLALNATQVRNLYKRGRKSFN